MMRKFTLYPIAIGLFAAALFSIPPALGQETSVFASFSLLDDGSCQRSLPFLELGFSRSDADQDIDAQVNTRPSGGNCEEDATGFDFAAEQRFPFAGGLAGLVKFEARQNSLAAPYAITGADGAVLTRADGGPSDPVSLPAGVSRHLAGIGGVSFTRGCANADIGGNVAPVDFADGSSSPTLHLALNCAVEGVFGGAFEAGFSTDWGEGGNFGSAEVSWSREMGRHWSVGLVYDYDWGLDALASEAPMHAAFAGLPAVNLGAPRGHAGYLSLRIGRRI